MLHSVIYSGWFVAAAIIFGIVIPGVVSYLYAADDEEDERGDWFI